MTNLQKRISYAFVRVCVLGAAQAVVSVPESGGQAAGSAGSQPGEEEQSGRGSRRWSCCF